MTATVSFEFFPPNTPEGMIKLEATRVALDAADPAPAHGEVAGKLCVSSESV